jgi:hypothetical protein
MVALKPDADRIKKFLNNLAKESWVKRTERRWWPLLVFHYTDIRNAVKVLQEGCLYSRKYLEDSDKLIVSSGSSKVLADTNTSIKDCVRLYFRPKTPTQYHAEGIRSQVTLSRQFPDAHCPVPVFFLFDSAQVIARDDCWFSDKGLGSRNFHIFSTAAELEQLPWKKIYQPGWVNPAVANAEVIVPKKLDLDALRYIYCRSDAERETLLYLLPPKLRNLYQNKVMATTRNTLFFRQHTFVETVRLSSKAAHIQFSPETLSPGPFHLRVCLQDESLKQYSRDVKDFKLGPLYRFEIPLPVANYTIHLFLDEHLAYANKYEETQIPF